MTSDVAAPQPLDLVDEAQLDFGDLQDRLVNLLDRHDYGRQRARWTYADLLDQLGERRLHSMAQAVGHDLVPVQDLQQAWRAGRGPIRPEHARALETAYLGEANLPWYTENLAHHFAAAAPQLSDFFHLWVAEEDQHSRAIELYLLFDRAVPAEEMLAAKSALLQAGREAPAADPFGCWSTPRFKSSRPASSTHGSRLPSVRTIRCWSSCFEGSRRTSRCTWPSTATPPRPPCNSSHRSPPSPWMRSAGSANPSPSYPTTKPARSRSGGRGSAISRCSART